MPSYAFVVTNHLYDCCGCVFVDPIFVIFHWQLQWWKHFNKTTHPKLAMQLTNLSSRKLFFIPLLWSITGYLGLPNMLGVDLKMVQVCSSCMQQDSCNTFTLSLQLFALECRTILAFGVAKMPKMSKTFARSRMVLELLHFWGNFNLDNILTRPITLWEGIWIPYNILYNREPVVSMLCGNISWPEIWKPQIAWELCAFKMFIGTFATAMLVGKYLQNFGQAHCQHESSTNLLKHGANKTQN